MAELASAYVTLIPSLKGASKSIQSALGGTNTTAIGNSLGGGILSGFKPSLGAITGLITGIAGSAAMAGGISRAMKLEQAEYKFKAMGINVDKAMQSCSDAVTGTAYGLDAAATIASQLGTSGVKAGDQMTQALKSATGMAAMGGVELERVGLVFSKVAATGRLQGDELMQFTEMGVNASAALAKHLGKSQAEVREMISAGEIDFQTFSDAMYATFGDAAKGANDTFSGAMSNVGAAVSRLTAKFAAPGLDGLRKVFTALIPAIDAVSGLMDPIVDKFSKFVAWVSDKAVAGLEAFTKTLEGSGSIFEAFKSGLASMLEGTALGPIVGKLVNGFKNFKLYIQGVGKALKAGVPPSKLLEVAVGKLKDKIAGLPDAFVGLLDAAQRGLKSLGDSIAGTTFGNIFGGVIDDVRLFVISMSGVVKALQAGVSPMDIIQNKIDRLPAPVQKVAEAFAQFGAHIAEALSGMSGKGAAALGIFSGIMLRFGGPIKTAVSAVAGFGGKVAGAFSKLGGISGIVGMIGTKLNTLGSAITLCGGGVKGFAAVLGGGLKGALGALVSPVGIVVAAVAALGAAFVYLMTTNSGFRETIMGLVTSIGSSLAPVIGVLAASFASLAANVLPVITNLVAQLLPVLGQIITVIFQVVAALAPVVAMIISTLVPILTVLISTVVSVASQILSAVLPVVSMILSVIQAAMPVISAVITTVMSVILGVIKAVWPTVQAIITTAMNVIRSVIQIVTGIIKGNWSQVWNGVKSLFSSVWNGIKGILKTAMNSVKSAVKNGIDKVISTVQKLPGKVKGFFSDAGSWLKDAGRNIIEGLWKGISNAGDWLWDKISGLGDTIIGAAKSALGIKSPSRRFAEEVGKFIPAGVGMGIKRGMGSALKSVRTMGDELLGATPNAADLAPFGEVTANVGYRAGGMTAAAAASGDVYNVYLNNNKVNDDEEIAAAFTSMLRVMKRKGAM